jgi:hypothetical protein
MRESWEASGKTKSTVASKTAAIPAKPTANNVRLMAGCCPTRSSPRAASKIPQSSSQLPICLVESNGAFEIASRIQDANFALPKARAGFGIVDGLIFLPDTGSTQGASKNFPSPMVGSDFN